MPLNQKAQRAESRPASDFNYFPEGCKVSTPQATKLSTTLAQLLGMLVLFLAIKIGNRMLNEALLRDLRLPGGSESTLGGYKPPPFGRDPQALESLRAPWPSKSMRLPTQLHFSPQTMGTGVISADAP